MRKPNNANKFSPSVKVKDYDIHSSAAKAIRRMTKLNGVQYITHRLSAIDQLAQLNTPEARKQRKAMNVHWHGKLVPTNVRGMYAGKKGMGAHPVRIKINAKNRPALAAMKKIMSGK